MPPTADGVAPTVDLRASVLDAAVSLGFRNSVMAKWIFDPVDDPDDTTAERTNPGLTSPSSSASTASQPTSEESSISPYNFRHLAQPLSHTTHPKLSRIDEHISFLDYDDQQPAAHPMVENTSVNGVGRKLTVLIPPTKEKRNKLRKPPNNGYGSDGGYVSEGGKKAKKGSRWKKKDGPDGYESDGGYLSEAPNTKKSKAKSKKGKEDPLASPMTDPGELLATVNASLLPPSSQLDGYLTDSAPTKRGRTKTKEKKTRMRPSSPTGGEEVASPRMPSRTRSFFRLMTRSASKDKDRERRPDTPSPPPPMPPLPAMLPIAERFARAGTPLGSSSPSTSMVPVLSTTSTALDVRSPAILSLNSLSNTLAPSMDAPRSVSPLSQSGTSGGEATLSTELWNNTVLIPGSNDGAKSMESREISREESDSWGSRTQRPEEGGHEDPLLPEPSSSRSRSNSPAEVNGFYSGIVKARKKVKKGALSTTVGGSLSSFDSASTSSKISTAVISLPNPHIAKERPSPSSLEIAAALNSRSLSPMPSMTNRKPLSPNLTAPRAESPSVHTPDSYVFVDRDERSPAPLGQWTSTDVQHRESIYNIVPSSAFIVPSRSPSPLSGAAPPAALGLAVRRAASVRALTPLSAPDTTPTQSRAGTPSQGEFAAARASVLAYYQLPPPSPPPTGPLPTPPPLPGGGIRSGSPRLASAERQFLSPGRMYGTLAPSPLRSLSPGPGPGPQRHTPGPSRSPSPGLFAQPIPSVRRGKESPFPARPILPPQDGRSLVARVARHTTPRVGEGSAEDGGEYDEHEFAGGSAEADGDGMTSSEEFVDTRSSTYIRAARARGEKRVYFSDTTTIEADALPEVEAGVVEEEDDGDKRARYAGDAVDTEDVEDRRSIATMSVYSRYSVLDEDMSAQVRNGFVQHVEEMYGLGKNKARWEDIPDVPELPAALRDAAAGNFAERRGALKTSSPYRF